MRYASLTLVVVACCGAADEQFSVVSIRPNDPNAMVTLRRMDPTTFDSTHTLKVLIGLAYGLQNYQIIGGPSWLSTQPYHVIAKTDSPASNDQMRRMLAAALRDRFQLQVHNRSELMSVYTLSVSRKGSKLQASKPETPRDGRGAVYKTETGMETHGSSMGLLTTFLTLELHRPVLNKTGLTGIYDIQLKYDEATPTEEQGTLGSIFTAMRQVGLSLKAEKSQVPVLVIDKVEPPSAN